MNIHTARENQPDNREANAELAWLRTENAFLRAQRDVLMRIASGYAEDWENLH